MSSLETRAAHRDDRPCRALARFETAGALARFEGALPEQPRA